MGLSTSPKTKEEDEPIHQTKLCRNKIMYFICCCLAFFSLGWVEDILGPILLEIQINTGVTFIQASSYFTMYNLAHICGSLSTSVLIGKLGPYISLTCSLGLIAVSSVAISLLESYLAMMGAFSCLGLATGLAETVALTEVMSLWSSDTDVPMHVACFAKNFGSMISPLSITPFLRQVKNKDISAITSSTNQSVKADTELTNYNMTINISLSTEISLISRHERPPSGLIFPLSIAAGITIMTSMSFIFFYFMSQFRKFKIDYKHDGMKPKNHLTGKHMYIGLILIGLLTALTTGIDDIFCDFISYYCFIQMGWSNQNGALVLSSYIVCCTIGSFCGIIYAKRGINPIKTATAHIVITILSFCGLILSGIYNLDAAMWISCTLAGFGHSVIWTLVCVIAEECFFPITGKIASFIVTLSCLGSAANAPFLSYFMEHVSNMFFGYIILTESCFCFVLICGCILLKEKKSVSPDSLANDKIVIPNYSSTSKTDLRDIR